MDNLELMPKFYPGWVLRLYYDLKPGHRLMSDLCRVACANPNIDLCYVRNIPAAGDVHKVFAMNWRFLPCLDEQVRDCRLLVRKCRKRGNAATYSFNKITGGSERPGCRRRRDTLGEISRTTFAAVTL
jgi:hypothetical protein